MRLLLLNYFSETQNLFGNSRAISIKFQLTGDINQLTN